MNSGSMPHRSAAEQAGERDAAARIGVQREALDELNGLFRQHQQAANLVLGGNGHFRQHDHAVHALIFDGGNDGDVGLAGAQRFGAKRGHGEGKVVAALERPVGEAPDERRGVQELDDGDAQFAHVLAFEARGAGPSAIHDSL